MLCVSSYIFAVQSAIVRRYPRNVSEIHMAFLCRTCIHLNPVFRGMTFGFQFGSLVFEEIRFLERFGSSVFEKIWFLENRNWLVPKILVTKGLFNPMD